MNRKTGRSSHTFFLRGRKEGGWSHLSTWQNALETTPRVVAGTKMSNCGMLFCERVMPFGRQIGTLDARPTILSGRGGVKGLGLRPWAG